MITYCTCPCGEWFVSDVRSLRHPLMDNYKAAGPTVLAFAISYILCGVFGWLARGVGFVDLPNNVHKKHKKPIPLLGGVAVLASFFLVAWTNATIIDLQFRLIFFSTGCMCLLGMIDDLWSLTPRTKFLGQIMICLPAAWIGFPLVKLNGFGFEIALGSFSPLFVLLWLTSCSNGINLLDGLDGVVGLVAVAICAGIACLALVQPNAAEFDMEAAIWLAACLLGFLVHNWYPARLYLGDAGSLSLGLLLGMLALRVETSAEAALDVPVMLMLFAVPLVDVTLAITRRTLSGRSIASPDNDHLHHRLHAFGFHVPHAALVAFIVAVGCGIAAVYAKVTGHELLACGFCLTVFAGLAVLGMFGDIEARFMWFAVRRWFKPKRYNPVVYPQWVSVGAKDLGRLRRLGDNTTAFSCVFTTASKSDARIFVVLEADEIRKVDVYQLTNLLNTFPRDLLKNHYSISPGQDIRNHVDPLLIPIDDNRTDPPDFEQQSAA